MGPQTEVDLLLARLSQATGRWRETPIGERISLLNDCADGVFHATGEWVRAACEAKGILPDSPTAGEEIAAGPLAVLRYLRLLDGSLTDIAETGLPRLPGKLRHCADGRLRVPLFPARGLYDRTLFAGYRAEAWLSGEATEAEFAARQTAAISAQLGEAGVALVLGAGNVSSIPAVDALMKLFQHNRVVLLKLNPVNDYLAAVFERAFQPLVSRGFLQICRGGTEVGGYAAQHALVDEVHITGSLAAHEAIVWGPPGSERDERKAAGRPVLAKQITSELGNVTPWIVVPGTYTERQLVFQAENVAAMITNNASFNCIAAKLIVTCRQWPQRERFLDKLQAALDRTPRRMAYYPGARDRFRRFAGREGDDVPPGTLPWTLVRDVDAREQSPWLAEESFVCVCAETALDADDAAAYLERAVELVNGRVWGTLGVGLMVQPSFRRTQPGQACWQTALSRLRYGTIGVNVWPALAYGMMCVPWGGYPGASLADPQSGIGWVHNPFFLVGVEKSVVEGPLVARLKPLWFASHRTAQHLARRVVDLYHRPAWWKLPRLALTAIRG